MQCSRSLFLHYKSPRLRDKLSAGQRAVFDRGHSVGALAQQLFPGGRTAEHPNKLVQVQKTAQLLKSGVPAIFEAAFIYKKRLAIPDILVNTGKKWALMEVKSSLEISETYLLDLAYQYHVLKGAGVEMESATFILPDKNFVKNGAIQAKSFFRIEDVTEEIEKRQEFIFQKIEALEKIPELSVVPDIQPGSHCFRPYRCDFQGFCWQMIPRNHIFQLPGLSLEEKQLLFDREKFSPEKISGQETRLFPEKTQAFIKADSTGKPFISSELTDFLSENFPFPMPVIYAETIRPCIPLADGDSPYTPFAWLFAIVFPDERQPEIHFAKPDANQKNPLQSFFQKEKSHACWDEQTAFLVQKLNPQPTSPGIGLSLSAVFENGLLAFPNLPNPSHPLEAALELGMKPNFLLEPDFQPGELFRHCYTSEKTLPDELFDYAFATAESLKFWLLFFQRQMN